MRRIRLTNPQTLKVGADSGEFVGRGKCDLLGTTALSASLAVASTFVLGAALMGTSPAMANPEDPNVVAGNVTINQVSATRLNVIQSSDKAVIDWRSFSIDANEHTDFQQPSTASIALNRVTGGTISEIFGRLTATGRVVLVNPNGVLFGPSSRVDVSGLIASSSDIRNEDFLAGQYVFDIPGHQSAVIVNRGQITAGEGGLVGLVAPGVENSGVIAAHLGRVTLASGDAFTLDLYGDELIRFTLPTEAAESLVTPDGVQLAALVTNSGTIIADGGTVVLSAAAAKGVRGSGLRDD